MYGAVLCPRTELTEAGEAHMGVLFLTNEGYSTMCGHATLALGRFFVDYAGSGSSSGMGALDKMRQLRFDAESKLAHVNLHAPCGLVYVAIPIAATPDGGWMTDLSRPISVSIVMDQRVIRTTQLPRGVSHLPRCSVILLRKTFADPFAHHS